MKSTMGLAEVIISDNVRRLDAEAGDHQHEDGPDQYEEHRKSPFPTSEAMLIDAIYGEGVSIAHRHSTRVFAWNSHAGSPPNSAISRS